MSEINNTQLDDNTDHDIATETTKIESTPDIAAAIAEAEERGYKRGCAEVQAQMQQQQEAKPQRQPYQVPADDNNQNNSTPTFLSHIRTGFWD
jgi:hypothetical protein